MKRTWNNVRVPTSDDEEQHCACNNNINANINITVTHLKGNINCWRPRWGAGCDEGGSAKRSLCIWHFNYKKATLGTHWASALTNNMNSYRSRLTLKMRINWNRLKYWKLNYRYPVMLFDCKIDQLTIGRWPLLTYSVFILSKLWRNKVFHIS